MQLPISLPLPAHGHQSSGEPAVPGAAPAQELVRIIAFASALLPISGGRQAGKWQDKLVSDR